MKSETRANWIFLAIFMCVMGPGLIMLTAKAYKKGAAGMSPPAPKTTVAYMNPTPQNPSLPRVLPPQTGSFIDSIAARLIDMHKGIIRVDRNEKSVPVLSAQRSLELVAAGPRGGTFSIALVGWHKDFLPLPDLYQFKAIRGQAAAPVKLIGYEQQLLPIDVRAELQKYGYLLPPDGVVWMLLEIEGAEPIDELELAFTLHGKVFNDRLKMPQPATVPPSTP